MKDVKYVDDGESEVGDKPLIFARIESIKDEHDHKADQIKEHIHRLKENKEYMMKRLSNLQKFKSLTYLSVSRISLQCRDKNLTTDSLENVIISDTNATKVLSLCGLRLEHMLKILEKMSYRNPSLLTNNKSLSP